MTVNSIDLNQKQPLEVLKDRLNVDTKKVVERSARDVFIGGLKAFLVLFGSIFGAVITSDTIKVNIIVSLLLFAFVGMSGLFLWFNKEDRQKILRLEKDQYIMAKSQLNIVDTMEVDFKIRLDQAMCNIENLYGDTVKGLTDQINDLIVVMVEERDKLHTLVTMMTTDYSNGVDQMTTESED